MTHSFWMLLSTSRARGNNSAEGCFCAIQTAMSSRRTSRAILIWPPLPLQRDRPVDTLPGFSQKRFKFTKLLVMVLAYSSLWPRACRTAATARAEAVAHLRRYENQYLEFWDGTRDRGQGRQSFSDYLVILVRMAQPAAWGGLLEIKALTRTAKCNILILPEDASMSACAFVLGDSRPNIVLWYTQDHYSDTLLPVISFYFVS